MSKDNRILDYGTPEYFQVNAGIKNIVGKELIYSDSVAIIELIKNSKDADASKAIITFEKETEITEDSYIIVEDNGKGMSLHDIQHKWLNIAYSEKKNTDKIYAGNKGVGRFSCDRLGKRLTLYTKSKNDDFLRLIINWEDFENKEINDIISQIPVYILKMTKNAFLEEINKTNFETGTILKIELLRDVWPTPKMKKLITELERFSPSLDNTFNIEIYSKNNDSDLSNKLNKKINNNILDKLSFKTTYIVSSINETGTRIDTTLFYQGNEVYSYYADNPYPNLKNIRAKIHFIDPLSRPYITRDIGIPLVEYGSIFLFYNNFRISPYGNIKNDWLGLDQRKGQGRARYLGTRELFGRIDIEDKNKIFDVLSNREGLAQNQAFRELAAYDRDEKVSIPKEVIDKDGKPKLDDDGNPILEEEESYGYITSIIRQLENFVVNGLEWNRLIDKHNPNSLKVISERDVLEEPDRYEIKRISRDSIDEVCNRLLKSKWKIKEVNINQELMSTITKVAEEKKEQFLKDFLVSIEDKDIKEYTAKEKRDAKKVIENLSEKVKAAEKNLDYEEKKRFEAEKEAIKQRDIAEAEKKRSAFLETLNSPEETLNSLITHIIKQFSGGIENSIKSILSIYYHEPDKITKEKLIEILENIAFDVSVIKESASMAKKANFNLKEMYMDGDLFKFIEEYIREVASKQTKWKINIFFENSEKHSFNTEFIPAEICVFLSNIFDNARKQKNTHNLYISCNKNKISFRDDGPGFDFDKFSSEDFIRKGISTTDDGTGLGLYHNSKIAQNINAKMTISNDEKNGGALIALEFKHENRV